MYNEELASKVRKAFAHLPRVEEKKMMGGVTFMVNGKMCVGVLKNDLMVRVGPEAYETALQKKGCKEMNFTGRPMNGFVFVGLKGTKQANDFKQWIRLGLAFNKKAKASKKRTPNKLKKN